MKFVTLAVLTVVAVPAAIWNLRQNDDVNTKNKEENSITEECLFKSYNLI